MAKSNRKEKRDMLKRDLNDGKYLAENLSFEEFKRIIYSKSHTGIVLLGTGGELDEWIRGVAGMFNERGIIKSISPVDVFLHVYELTTSGGRTDLVLVFHKNKHYNVEKLQKWRQVFGDTSLIDDYIINYANQHEVP